MADFYLKKHDLLPTLQAVLKDSTGAIANLTTAVGVVFNMVPAGGGSPKINRGVANVLDAQNGLVEYAWTGTDTDTVGDYNAEFEVDFPSSKPETFPNTTNITVSIVADLA